MKKVTPVPDYNDRYPRMWAAMLAGLFICAFGMREQFVVLVVEHFWAVCIVYMLSSGLAWFLIWYIGKITRLLDRSHPWHTAFNQRLLRQLWFGMVIPAGVILLFAVGFFYSFTDSAPLDAGYFYADYSLSILLLVILNMCYAFAYMAEYSQLLRAELESLRSDRAVGHMIGQLTEQVRVLENQVVDPPTPPKKVRSYSLTDEAGAHAILFSEIAYFKMCSVEDETGKYHRYIELTCLNGEKFTAKEHSLARIRGASDGYFKQISRQYLAAPHALSACSQDENGHLTLTLFPENVNVVLSGKKSQHLKPWILEQVNLIAVNNQKNIYL